MKNEKDLMDMTTIEYLSHQQQRKYYSDHYEDEEDENPWRRPYYPNPWKRRIMGMIRKFYMVSECYFILMLMIFSNDIVYLF